MTPPRIAVLDDTQRIARDAADWSVLHDRAEVSFLHHAFADEDRAARELAPFQIIVPTRERTPFPASLIARLPALRLIALTGARAPSLDVAACSERGVLVCNTGMNSGAATAELAIALMLCCVRSIPAADAVMKKGGWHDGVAPGIALEGRRLGLVGLGKLGSRVARYAQALGMEVVAWSQNLTDADAAERGAIRVDRDTLFRTADIVSVHLVLSGRSRGLIGAEALTLMKPGAILVNTSRGPIVDEAALVTALREGRITAGLDVFDHEPLPVDHPLRHLPNVVLTPHLGYGTRAVFEQIYRESVENIAAFLDGRPIRMVNPEALEGRD